MDQSRFWIQKQQPCLNSHVLSSFGDSWEEQAFAEDATGPLGGCVWPPRSYTCSFCRREFRSAQALGGHMNVHRRDRARLKKISSSNNMINQVVLQNPNKICNPNLELDHMHPLLTSSSSPRSSTVSIVRPFAFSFGQEHQKGTPILSCSKFEKPQKRFHIAEMGNLEKGSTKVLESNFTTLKRNNQQIEVHLASELNSLVKRRCDRDVHIFDNKDDHHDEQDCLIYKKRRIDRGDEAESVVPLKRSTNSSLETLDLELRLGDHRS